LTHDSDNPSEISVRIMMRRCPRKIAKLLIQTLENSGFERIGNTMTWILRKENLEKIEGSLKRVDRHRKTKRCGSCSELRVIGTGSQIILICRRTGRTKDSYSDTCDLER